MNWENILTTFFTACVPAALTYFATKKQMDSKIKEVEIQSANEIKRLEKETELRIKESQQQYQMDLTNKFFTGELDVSHLTNAVGQLAQLKEVVNRLQK